MTKYTSFKDIPQFVDSHYKVDSSWEYMVNDWVPNNIKDCGLDIDPDFQRGDVWNLNQQVSYLEFILRGGRSGTELFFNHPNWMTSFKGDFVLVDGKQRLKAVTRFINNEIPAFGTLYGDYTDSIRISSCNFKVNISRLQTRAEVLQWYIDLNTMGTAHTDDEIAKVRGLLKETTV